MPTALENANVQLLAVLAGVSGIAKAYADAPETMGEFPCVFSVPLRSESYLKSDAIQSDVTLKAEVHIARGILPEADKKAKPLFNGIEDAIWADSMLAGTVATVNRVRIEYVVFKVGPEEHAGLRVEVEIKMRRVA